MTYADPKVNSQKCYHITEPGADWGVWGASNAAEAVALLRADVADMPDAYCGAPSAKLRVEEV